MYNYSESGLPNVYLANGVNFETIDGEKYTSINALNQLHDALALEIVHSRRPITPQEFRFLRIEMDVSKKVIARDFGLDAEIISAYEAGPEVGLRIPRTVDASLRCLYMEFRAMPYQLSHFLDLAAGSSLKPKLIMQEKSGQWSSVTS